MGSRLKLLRGGACDFPARQQTLREHDRLRSYELLDAGEQRLFALLSVFSGYTIIEGDRGGSGRDRISGKRLGVDILDGLASLVEKSLVRKVDQVSGETRLVMLETIREYARERLETDPEFSGAAIRAHATYLPNIPTPMGTLTGNEREAALADLEADIENVRTAWRYWVAEKGSRAAGQIYR